MEASAPNGGMPQQQPRQERRQEQTAPPNPKLQYGCPMTMSIQQEDEQETKEERQKDEERRASLRFMGKSSTSTKKSSTWFNLAKNFDRSWEKDRAGKTKRKKEGTHTTVLVAQKQFALSASSVRVAIVIITQVGQSSLRAPVRTQITFVDLAFSLTSFDAEGAGICLFHLNIAADSETKWEALRTKLLAKDRTWRKGQNER